MSDKKTKFVAGFTIVELLIALAITGLILVAVAVAFNASVMNYQENQGVFKTINSARQAMTRMTTDLRTAQAVDPTESADRCSLIKADGSDITYRYDSTDNKLYLITNDDLSDSDYVLCENVTVATFQKDTETVDSVTHVKSVQISMTVESGNVQRSVAAAAVIRRNLN